MCMCGVLLDCEDELRGSFSVLQPFCGKEERFVLGKGCGLTQRLAFGVISEKSRKSSNAGTIT